MYKEEVTHHHNQICHLIAEIMFTENSHYADMQCPLKQLTKEGFHGASQTELMQTQSNRKDLSRTHTSKNSRALLLLMKAPRKTIHVPSKGNGNWQSKQMIPSTLKTIKIHLSITPKKKKKKIPIFTK
jgi:hypothetical protein